MNIQLKHDTNLAPVQQPTRKTYELAIRWSWFFIGLWITAYGLVCTINANLGVAPWDALHIALSKMTPISIGTWSIIMGALIMGITCLMTRRLPQLGTIANMIIVGLYIDSIRYLKIVPEVNHLWSRVLLMIVGILLLCVGLGTYIAARVGAGPRDGMVLEVAKRTGWSIRLVRTIMEVTVGVVAFALEGPIQLGTLFFVFMMGPFMQLSIQICDRALQSFLKKRGVLTEDIHQGALRAHDHDGSSE